MHFVTADSCELRCAEHKRYAPMLPPTADLPVHTADVARNRIQQRNVQYIQLPGPHHYLL